MASKKDSKAMATSPAMEQVNSAQVATNQTIACPQGTEFQKESSKLEDLDDYIKYVKKHWNVVEAYRKNVFNRGQSCKDILIALEKQLKNHWKPETEPKGSFSEWVNTISNHKVKWEFGNPLSELLNEVRVREASEQLVSLHEIKGFYKFRDLTTETVANTVKSIHRYGWLQENTLKVVRITTGFFILIDGNNRTAALTIIAGQVPDFRVKCQVLEPVLNADMLMYIAGASNTVHEYSNVHNLVDMIKIIKDFAHSETYVDKLISCGDELLSKKFKGKDSTALRKWTAVAKNLSTTALQKLESAYEEFTAQALEKVLTLHHLYQSALWEMSSKDWISDKIVLTESDRAAIELAWIDKLLTPKSISVDSKGSKNIKWMSGDDSARTMYLLILRTKILRAIDNLKDSWKKNNLWNDFTYQKFAEKITNGGLDGGIIADAKIIHKNGRTQKVKVELTKVSKDAHNHTAFLDAFASIVFKQKRWHNFETKTDDAYLTKLYEKEFQYPGPYKEASEEQQLIKKQRPKVTDHGILHSDDETSGHGKDEKNNKKPSTRKNKELSKIPSRKRYTNVEEFVLPKSNPLPKKWLKGPWIIARTDQGYFLRLTENPKDDKLEPKQLKKIRVMETLHNLVRVVGDGVSSSSESSSSSSESSSESDDSDSDAKSSQSTQVYDTSAKPKHLGKESKLHNEDQDVDIEDGSDDEIIAKTSIVRAKRKSLEETEESSSKSKKAKTSPQSKDVKHKKQREKGKVPKKK